MHLNHLDLPVPDVAATAEFFLTHFGFRPVYRDEGMAILLDDAGFSLVLNRLGAGDAGGYPKAFHIGFLQPSADAVRDTVARLRAAGVDVPEPRAEHAATVAFLRAPGGILVEISHRPPRAS